MEYVKAFAIGGSVIAGSKLAAEYASPALAPIVGGMPTGIIAAFFLAGDQKKREYYAGYAYSAFVLFLAILAIHLMTIRFPKMSVSAISLVALVLWAVLSYLAINYFVPKKH